MSGKLETHSPLLLVQQPLLEIDEFPMVDLLMTYDDDLCLWHIICYCVGMVYRNCPFGFDLDACHPANTYTSKYHT